MERNNFIYGCYFDKKTCDGERTSIEALDDIDNIDYT